MEKRKVMSACVRLGHTASLWILFAMAIVSFSSTARAGVTATISQGYPQATPDTVALGADSVLAYNVTITGLNPHESVSSQVTGQVYVFEAGDQVTDVNGQHLIATVKDGSASASTFTITVDGSSMSEGSHAVSFVKGYITLADGTIVYLTPGYPAPTDTFTVAGNVVTVSGQPYCVIPANTNEQWDSDVTSTYRASANFGLATFSYYHWSGSANVNLENSETLFGSVNCDGVTSTGPGKVTCTVYSYYVDQPYSGDAQVTVANQFTWNWQSLVTRVINTGVPNGVMTQLDNATFSKTLTVNVTANAELQITIPLAGDEDTVAAQSLGLTLGTSGSAGSSTTYSFTAPPNGWILIGDVLNATEGTRVTATPSSGPGAAQTVFKYSPVSSGAAAGILKAGLPPTAYAAGNGIYVDPF